MASITPLVAERSVLKLKGERADKKIAHWQAVAVAACEQCGRNRVPWCTPPSTWRAGCVHQGRAWRLPETRTVPPAPAAVAAGRYRAAARSHGSADGQRPVLFLSGPEGGLSPAEEDLAVQHGFAPVTLGPRVLRAETALLAALAALTL